MRITKLHLGSIKVPLRRPFITALRAIVEIDDTLIKLETDDGLIGWGEAPATPVITGDTKGGIHDGLVIAFNAIKGLDLVEDWELIQTRLAASMVHNTSAKAAIDIALHDLVSQATNQPLFDWLGGCVRKELITDLTISVDTPDAMVAAAIEATSSGFDILKIKVGTNAALDVVRLREIRDAVGSAVRLRLDANQGWTPAEAITVITALEDAGIAPELVEQPVAAADFAGLKLVTDTVYTPILADEAVFSYHDANKIISEHVADLINLKLMKTGGIYQACKIIDLAKNAGVDAMVGAMMETSVSITAAAHLAVSAEPVTMIDLDPPLLCASNPVRQGMAWLGASIILPDAPGLGITEVIGGRFGEVYS